MVSKRASAVSSPAAVPPSSSTPSKITSSAASSQSHTTSSLKSSGSATPSSKSTASGGAKTKAELRKDMGDVWNPAENSTETIDVLLNAVKRYRTQTPHRLLVIDSFMVFLMVLGMAQFAYCVVAGNYPFNAFLSGFSATVGQFVLTASLRMQTNPTNNKGNFEAISDERAFADYVLGSLILPLFCVNFIN